MTFLLAIPLLAAMLTLSSCVLSGKNAAKTPATAPPPSITAAAKPAPPPPPLSTPQTEIQLPPAQAISAAALATIPTVRETLPAPEPDDELPVKAPAKSRPAASAPKPESSAPAAEASSAPQGPATPPAEDQPRLQPVYPEEQRRRIWTELESRKKDIDAMLHNLIQSRMSADQKNVLDRIQSFIKLAEDTARRGDFRSAEALSEKAVILARELSSGR